MSTHLLRALIACLAASFASGFSFGSEPIYSRLWQESDHTALTAGRLPDFSFAGYHEGASELPKVMQTCSVKDFGATGDGVTDDTNAIKAAIAATDHGAILIPAGRYKITDFIRIEKSGVVLRGAGPDRSIFWFPHGLDELHPRVGKTSTGSPASGYSFNGAFLTMEGDYRSQQIGRVTALAKRGDRNLQVDAVNKLTAGQLVLLVVHETKDQSLKTYLYNGDPGDISHGKTRDTKMLLRVISLNGKEVHFDRPIRFETRAEWKPELKTFEPSVTESGIEHLGFAFPNERYRGHFKESGFNAIELRQVANCWVHDVAIHNGDLGINITACQNTVDGVVVTADHERGSPQGVIDQCTGHHGIQCNTAEDNLIEHFDFQTSYVHDLSVEQASGNVFSRGRGADLNFDHHKDTPYENLYTEIDCGRGARVWACGGGEGIGRQSAGWETFWNIRAARPITPPAAGWGPSTMNFVAMGTTPSKKEVTKGIWVETISPDAIAPQNLYSAQLARRLGAK